MIEYVLKTNELTKNYHGTNALTNVSITLEQGKIYGLIGENGAGKSTLMRIITGLSFPTSGSIELFGHTSKKEVETERRRIGCMIENPGLNLNMNAKENLKLHRIIRGIANEEIEEELLHFVGLSDAGKKKVKAFSLGMKQRLGIALTLLGDPELLILDEPINGLDPVGVVEIRNLLKRLSVEKQITILISSHNLPELYQVATDYIIIHKGEIKKTLTLPKLEECCKHHFLIECNQPEKLLGVLEMNLNTSNYKVMPDKKVKLYDYLEDKELVVKTIMKSDILVTNFSIEGDTLENYFLSVIGGEVNA